MAEYYLRFPRGMKVDVDNPPANFDELVAQNFRDYTKGTRIEYRFEDKLAWIDIMRELANGSRDAHEAVKKIAKDHFEHMLDEYDEIEEPEYYSGIEFAEMCYEVGAKGFYEHGRGHSGKQDEQILRLMARAIKVIMNYPEVEDDAQT